MPFEFTLNPVPGALPIGQIAKRIFAIPSVRKWVPYPQVAKWILPWTLIMKPFGAVTVTVDVVTYYTWWKATKELDENWPWFHNNVPTWDQIGGQVLDFIRNAPDVDLVERWANRTDADKAAFFAALGDIREGNAQLVFEMPPLWFVDP